MRYKTQSVISIIGLAVGFVCFALSALWIRYEMTFDNFHPNADRLYVIYSPGFVGSEFDRTTVPPLAAYLKATFPEVEEAMPINPWGGNEITVDDVTMPALVIQADTTIFRMFDVRMVQGNLDFLAYGSGQVAITQRKARQLFGNASPIGKTVTFRGNKHTITAVVSDMPLRSNYPFNFISPFLQRAPEGREWNHGWGENTILRLHSGIDLEAFRQRLYEHVIDAGMGSEWTRNLTIKPLTRIRTLDPTIQTQLRFQHILIFSLSGLLVIICSLFNYLTLFITRFRMRQKEMALRKVCGASGRSLMGMLSTEFLLTLLLATLVGGALTKLVHGYFLELSNIQMSLADIYRELLVYVGGVMLISLLVFWLIVFILQRRSLNISIRRSNRKVSRKVSVVVQLIISIGFAFCSLVILKQMHFLQHSDVLGFSFHNRGAIHMWGDGVSSSVLTHRLSQIPELTTVLDARGMTNLLPQNERNGNQVTSWDGQPPGVEYLRTEWMWVTPEYLDFWDFQLIAGEMLNEGSPEGAVLINESAARELGWYVPDAIGKNFISWGTHHTVKGVIRNVYHNAPTTQVSSVVYVPTPQSRREGTGAALVLFKYREGSWETVRESVEQAAREEFGDLPFLRITNATEEYARFLQSENALMRLLFFISLICILICIFGFVSLVSLTCEERRKEIAIRKINGATIGNILGIFAKEYFLLLIIGAVIAFSGGYIIMQRWLEQYVKQTAIPAWVYLSIISAMALIIVLCVGWRVWRASIENPADVMKGG
jgi:cell division protein FtsX